MPGFAVGVVEAGAAVAAAAEQEAGASAGGVERNNVPGVFGDDVGGEEVDFAGKVGDGASVDAAMGVDTVEAFEKLGGTLHLDAPEGRGEVGREGRDFEGLAAGEDVWIPSLHFFSSLSRPEKHQVPPLRRRLRSSSGPNDTKRWIRGVTVRPIASFSHDPTAHGASSREDEGGFRGRRR